MKTITRKREVVRVLDACFQAYQAKGLSGYVDELYHRILKARVRFPLLELCGAACYTSLPAHEHIGCCDRIAGLHTEGGNVILGILLQKRLEHHFEQSIQKATEYIVNGSQWYVCDIIGERVFGYSLLTRPAETLNVFRQLIRHENRWVIRSLGAAAHYAIKKGLDPKNAGVVFGFLLSMARAKDRQIRQGVGWAAKTTARFYPKVIEHYKHEIENETRTARWFRTKIHAGLEWNAHAQSHKSQVSFK